MKVVEVHAPEYSLDRKPDYTQIGLKVDSAIGSGFPDGRYILRAIGSDDHPGLSLNRLADKIIETGTDKYHPTRKAVGHDEFSGYDYDIQAGTIEIKKSRMVITKDDKYRTVFGTIAYLFYEHAPLDRGYPVRIDVLILYDPKKLRLARKFHPKARSVRKGLNRFLYKFKEPGKKMEAVLGIVKILR